MMSNRACSTWTRSTCMHGTAVGKWHVSCRTKTPLLREKCACKATAGPARTLQLTTDDGIKFNCHSYVDQLNAKHHPTMVVLSDIYGIDTEDSHAFCWKLAEQGFEVLTPDPFVDVPWSQDESPGSGDKWDCWIHLNDGAHRCSAGSFGTSVALTTAAYAKSMGSPWVAVLGVCWGGGRVVDALHAADQGSVSGSESTSTPLLSAGVAFYGTRIRSEKLQGLSTPVALYFAQLDDLVPSEDISRMREALAQAPAMNKSQLKVFANQDHGFVHHADKRDGEAASDAFVLAMRFISQVAPKPKPAGGSSASELTHQKASNGFVTDLVSIDVDGHATECVKVMSCDTVVSDAGSTGSGRAVVMLSDVYGCHARDTVSFAAKFACATGATVYIPDLFRGQPWHVDGPPAGSPEYEQWRAQFADTWAPAVAVACAQQARAEGCTHVTLLGTCYGGGRVVDVLAGDAPDEAGSNSDRIFAGGVAYYGTRITVESLQKVQVPIALYFAGADSLVSSEVVQHCRHAIVSLRETSGVEGQVTVFARQPHAFAHHAGVGDPDAKADAIYMGTSFLQKL